MKNNDHIFTRIAYGIILLVSSLRVIVFFQNRSLFIDEASLSSQIIDKSFSDLFGNFVDQFAPPLFCVILKTSTELFGNTEYALRLFPLIMGLLGIVFFYEVCKLFLEPKHVLFPLILFGFSVFMMQYSTEVKQYSSDTTFSLGILLLGLKITPSTLNYKHFLFLGFFGIIVIWFSMPSVFMLFSLGVYYGFSFIKTQDWKRFSILSVVTISWLISFGVYFFGIIKNDLGIDKLESFHSPFFIPLPPQNFDDFIKTGNILLSFFQTAIGSTVIASVWGMIATTIGIYVSFKKDKLIAGLLLIPILTAMFASGLQMYSLLPRLTLFFIPILVLFIGVGTQTILKGSPKIVAWIALSIMTLIVLDQKSYPYYFQSFEIEELRPVLEYVKEESSYKDFKYIHFQAENAYVFYSQFYEFKDEINLENDKIGLWSDNLNEVLLNKKEERIWLIFSHYKQTEIDQILLKLKDKLIIEDQFKTNGASCYLLTK